MASGNKKGELGPNLGESLAKTISEEGMVACFLRTVPAQKIYVLLSLPRCLSVHLSHTHDPSHII